MTNKTICHVNNVNNNSPSKSALNKALSTQSSSTTPTPTSTSQSTTTVTSSQSNGKSNNISNTSQINNNNNHSNNNNNNIKLCPEGGCNVGRGGDRGGGIGVGGGGITKAYAHGIWYQEYDTIDNSVQQQIQYLQQQRQRLHQHNVKGAGGGGGVANATIANGYVLHPENDEMLRRSREQHQRQHRSINSKTGGGRSTSSSGINININANQQSNCDIVIVDIEDEPYQAATSPPPPNRANKPTSMPTPTPTQPSKSSSSYLINESLSLRNSKQNLLDETIIERQVKVAHVATTASDNLLTRGKVSNEKEDDGDAIDDGNDEDEDDDDDDIDDDDSLASMETLSDNVSIWIDGEKHWIAGVDDQTTCADLIWALLNYQNGQPEHRLNTNTIAPDNDVKGIANSGVYKELQHTSSYSWDNRNGFASTVKPVGNNSSQAASTTSTHGEANNQSMPINTKEEHFKITQNLSRTVAITTSMTGTGTGTRMVAGCNATVLPCAPATVLPLPPGITTPAQLATEYVIVKQYQHCEEYLDGSTKVFDVLPPRDSQHKKECELLLRRLGPAPPPPPPQTSATSAYANNTTPQLSSLISTDKDSGMGSPVGSARSAKFRRRKHKSSQWLAQANTLHPRLSRCTATANERLLKIILAQDETIQRQLSLLREKERQINKIEEEKHRKRERELGKNYLLETYLNGLDEAECEPEHQEGEDIFIGEAYQHLSATSPIRLPSSTSTSVATQKTPTTTTHFDVETITLDKNFKPKDIKKEKKKKRHKDKTSKDEDTKKHAGITQAKEKAEEQLHQQRLLNNEMTNIPGSVLKNADSNEGEANGSANKAETEMQIYWLEKVYTLNKQLQKEEELAAKLHAKIRKHQLKKANQTQKEVQLEIDKLDNCLAMQCGDIRRVEANLMETNDQLQKKLLVLERLSLDYIRQQEGEEQQTDEHQQNQENENCTRADVSQLTPKLLDDTTEIQQLSLSNIRSAEEVEKLQKLIAKPSLDMHATNGREQHHHNVMTSIWSNIESHMLADYPENNDSHLVFGNCNSKAPLSTALIADQRKPVKTDQPPSRTTRLTAAAPPAVVALTAPSPSSATSSASTTSSSSCLVLQTPAVVLDKNMLSSLHVQNAKTIKKQMFHSQTVRATTPPTYSTATATATSTALPTPTLPPPAPPLPTAPVPTTGICPGASEMNALSLQQCDQNFNPHMVLPLASSSSSSSMPALITLRPENSHQHEIPNAFMVNRPPAVGVASLAPIQATMAVAAAAAVTCISSSSSPASLMAMNTVDISQLGTLV